MEKIDPHFGLGTLVTHAAEHEDPRFAHVTPIYETSTFAFPDVATGAAIFKGENPGLNYTRWNNPNQQQLADKLAVLEGLDLLRAQPERALEEVAAGMTFASGMAAISAVLLSKVHKGQVVIAQKAIYSATHELFEKLAPNWGIETVFL